LRPPGFERARDEGLCLLKALAKRGSPNFLQNNQKFAPYHWTQPCGRSLHREQLLYLSSCKRRRGRRRELRSKTAKPRLSEERLMVQPDELSCLKPSPTGPLRRAGRREGKPWWLLALVQWADQARCRLHTGFSGRKFNVFTDERGLNFNKRLLVC
jgi:hypothetical protein